MPYTIVQNGDQYCVHKKNPDGSAGEQIACHDSQEMASRQIGAIMHNEGKSFVQFKQDADGNWWYLGCYSNKYKDRDEEIISEAAHKEYADWVKDKGVRPQVTLFHMPRHSPGLWGKILKAHEDGKISTSALNAFMKDFYKDYSIAETERVFLANGFIYVAARVHPDKIHVVKKLINYKEKLGMSHGFVPKEVSGNIFEKYRSFEYTVLPARRAANVWNPEPQFSKEEIGMALDKDVEQFLDETIGQGTANEVDEQTQKAAQELEQMGTEYKENDTPEVQEPEKTEETPAQENLQADAEKAYAGLVDRIVGDLKFKEFVEAVKAQLNSMQEKVDAAEARIKELEKEDDEKFSGQYQQGYANLLEMFSVKAKNVATETPEPKKDVFDPVAFLLS